MDVMIPPVDIPAVRLRPEAIEPDTPLGVPSAGSDVGFRHQLGGEPAFQPAAWPVCTGCQLEMTFYGQLDTINADVVLADVGVVLVFVCFDCYESASMVMCS